MLSLFGNKECKFHSYGKAKKSGIIIAYAFLALMFFSAGSSVFQTEKPVATNKAETQQSAAVKAEEKKNKAKSEGSGSATNAAVTGELKVHFIDVGQADSILVQQGNQAMLIDAGNNADDKTVKGYLDSVGVKSLDYVIGTHPHEDHIGVWIK